MKHIVWSGALPRYWVDSPWWADAEGDLILLTPAAEGTSLSRIQSDGQKLWERPVVASLLANCGDGIVVTARVRDQRTDAAYYQFTALSTTTGELIWELPRDLTVNLPKGVVPQFPINESEVLIRLDRWRRLRDGSPTECATEPTPRGEWRYGSTIVMERPSGLTVEHGRDTWVEPSLKLRDLLGISGALLVGTEQSGALWARELSTGRVRWSMGGASQELVVPSERVAGLEADCRRFASAVPVAAIVREGQVLVLQETACETLLVTWPRQLVLERWPAEGAVVLLGLVGEHALVLEEYKDGMGCLWLFP